MNYTRKENLVKPYSVSLCKNLSFNYFKAPDAKFNKHKEVQNSTGESKKEVLGYYQNISSKNNFKKNGLSFYKKLQSNRNAIIYLHGYGGSFNSINKYLLNIKNIMPYTDVIAVNAPIKLSDGGYGWFNVDLTNYVSIIKSTTLNSKWAAKCIDIFINELEDKYNLQENHIALLGFSQGSILAGSYAINYNKQFASTVVHSGYFVNFHLNKKLGANNVLFLYGDKENPDRLERIKQSFIELDKLNIPYSMHKEINLNHTMSQKSINTALAFIKNKFNE